MPIKLAPSDAASSASLTLVMPHTLMNLWGKGKAAPVATQRTLQTATVGCVYERGCTAALVQQWLK
jgi:hypothetical protein